MLNKSAQIPRITVVADMMANTDAIMSDMIDS